MRRGDVVVALQPGTYTSKPRPCLVVQSNAALPSRSVVTICPLSSTLQGASLIRVPIMPTVQNGLRRTSEVEIDYLQAIAVENVAQAIGSADEEVMARVDEALRRWLDL